MKEKIEINPKVLKWAREDASYTLEDVATRLSLSPKKTDTSSSPRTATECLEAWENGQDSPSFTQLQKLAHIYQRPLMTFFLTTPPKQGQQFLDFRTIQSRPIEHDTPEFSKLKRRLKNLQHNLSYIVQKDRKKSLDFVGKTRLDANIVDFVQDVRHFLKVPFEKQTAFKTEDELFKFLRDQIQDAGVFVVIEGDLGNYMTAIDTSEFRGMAIADKYAPLIVINSKDTKNARIFTLLHEFAHICLGNSSISNISMDNYGIDPRESFCNKFAAEFLIPTLELKRVMGSQVLTNDATKNMLILSNLSKYFKTSIVAVARRLKDCHFLTTSAYNDIVAIITKAVHNKKNKQTGFDKNKFDKYRLGKKVLLTVVGAIQSGHINIVDASRILNLNYTRIDRILMP